MAFDEKNIERVSNIFIGFRTTIERLLTDVSTMETCLGLIYASKKVMHTMVESNIINKDQMETIEQLLSDAASYCIYKDKEEDKDGGSEQE
jgi:hypothetical protein